MRAAVSDRASHLAGLQYVDATANFFAPVMARWAETCLAVAGQPWEVTTKPLSQRGFDVQKHRWIDYGNCVCRVVIKMWGLSNRDICASMVRAAGTFAALHPARPDTPRVLDRQGDVVEIMMAMCRGDESYELHEHYRAAEWMAAYNQLIMLCRALDFLYASLRGGSQKLSPWIRTPRIASLQEGHISCMANSSAAFATITSALAVNLRVV